MKKERIWLWIEPTELKEWQKYAGKQKIPDFIKSTVREKITGVVTGDLDEKIKQLENQIVGLKEEKNNLLLTQSKFFNKMFKSTTIADSTEFYTEKQLEEMAREAGENELIDKLWSEFNWHQKKEIRELIDKKGISVLEAIEKYTGKPRSELAKFLSSPVVRNESQKG